MPIGDNSLKIKGKCPAVGAKEASLVNGVRSLGFSTTSRHFNDPLIPN